VLDNRWGGREWIYFAPVLPKGRYRAFIYDRINNPATESNCDAFMTLNYSEPCYSYLLSCPATSLVQWNPTANSDFLEYEKTSSSSDGSLQHFVWTNESKGANYGEFGTHDFVSFGNDEIVYNKITNGAWHNGSFSHVSLSVYDDTAYHGIEYPIETRISNAAGESINPSVATNANGNKVFVVWEDYRNNGNARGKIYFNSSATAGDAWFGEYLIASSAGNCVEPSVAYANGIMHVVYVNKTAGGNELYYMKSDSDGASWQGPVRITIASFQGCDTKKPSIVADNAGNAYVAWEDTRTGTSEIFFQKVPSNFAPFTSSTMTTMSMPRAVPVVVTSPSLQSYSTTLEAISPKGGKTVQSLRPTFSWYGLNGIKDYRIECSTMSDEASLAASLDYFTTTISDVSSPKPLCEFIVPEHSMGLDENDGTHPYWYWRITTINTSEVATSEVASFRVALPDSLTSVTNWPNPFNPNKERTKIRYRLGKQASDVVIKIYDITGSLVRELDGTCNAEGASIWNKFNDVEWDGRNGRGDIVMNGIYPFEVIVNYGGRSVSARGKIAVLK
jgi:hypothetical protein